MRSSKSEVAFSTPARAVTEKIGTTTIFSGPRAARRRLVNSSIDDRWRSSPFFDAAAGCAATARYWKVTRVGSARFEVAPPPTTSRCHAWKFQVSPGRTGTVPVPRGMAPRPIGTAAVPDASAWKICPGASNRPMLPPRQRTPSPTGRLPRAPADGEDPELAGGQIPDREGHVVARGDDRARGAGRARGARAVGVGRAVGRTELAIRLEGDVVDPDVEDRVGEEEARDGARDPQLVDAREHAREGAPRRQDRLEGVRILVPEADPARGQGRRAGVVDGDGEARPVRLRGLGEDGQLEEHAGRSARACGVAIHERDPQGALERQVGERRAERVDAHVHAQRDPRELRVVPEEGRVGGLSGRARGEGREPRREQDVGVPIGVPAGRLEEEVACEVAVRAAVEADADRGLGGGARDERRCAERGDEESAKRHVAGGQRPREARGVWPSRTARRASLNEDPRVQRGRPCARARSRHRADPWAR